MLLKSVFKDLGKSNSLGYNLAVRNMKSRYRGSVLGILWAILPPVATAMLWVFLKGVNVINFNNLGVPYYIFVMTGTFLWQIFISSINQPISQVQSNKAILVKLNISRESFFFSALYQVIANMLISFLLIILIILFSGIIPGMGLLVSFIVIFAIVMLGSTIGLFLLPFALLYRDIQMGLPYVLQLFFYLTPVVYPAMQFKGAFAILKYNPLNYLVSYGRGNLLGIASGFDIFPLLLAMPVLLIFLLLGLVVQRIAINVLVERMGS